MSNILKKKHNANVHNQTMDISTHIFSIGQCACEKGELFLYLKSNEENIFNIYCTNCDAKRDFRKLDVYEDLKLLYPPSAILKTLTDVYGEEACQKE